MMIVTVVTAPVYVDAATISTCELGQRETGWIGCHRGKTRGKEMSAFYIQT